MALTKVLRSLIEAASSVDQERTRLTREALLSLVQTIPDQKRAVGFLADFTRVHDAFEAAIMMGSSESEVAARRAACLALLDQFATRH
jgi:hypothetical protein